MENSYYLSAQIEIEEFDQTNIKVHRQQFTSNINISNQNVIN